MELWIRNKQKTVLTKITTICLDDDDRKYITGYNENSQIEIGLGRYKTKKRALEVLNEIQKCLLLKVYIPPQKIEQDSDLVFRPITTMDIEPRVCPLVQVYEMPKE